MPKESPGERLQQIGDAVASCRACPRLVAWREQAAAEPRAAYRSEPFWARGVPGFGDPHATTVIVGLAPAANGANRTGRMFTGDRSGDFLFASLFRTGYANQATSTHANDGLRLAHAYITAAVRCAPPMNRPTPTERDTCRSFLAEELETITTALVVVSLGAFALDALWSLFKENGRVAKTERRFHFSHGNEIAVGGVSRHQPLTILCSYHPSQRNVFTGLLTADALDQIFVRARALSDSVGGVKTP